MPIFFRRADRATARLPILVGQGRDGVMVGRLAGRLRDDYLKRARAMRVVWGAAMQ